MGTDTDLQGGPPPPAGPPPPFWRIGQLVIPEAAASPASQATTYLVAASAIGMVAHVGRQPAVGITLASILLVGVLVGLATGTARYFQQASGTVMGIVASVVTVVAIGLLGSIGAAPFASGETVLTLVVGVGLFVAGLDWTRVARLRTVPVMAAVPVLLVTAADRGPMLAIGLAWLALAVAALWSLECDQRAAFTDPRPLTPHAPPTPEVEPRDLAGAVAIALLLGLLFAFSASMPSCSMNIPGIGRFGPRAQVPSMPSVPFNPGRLSLDDIRFGNFPFDFDGKAPSILIDGVEHLLREGASGMLFLENTETGERFALRMEGDNLVARSSTGEVIAVIRSAEAAPKTDRDRSIPWKQIAVGAALLAGLAIGVWWYLRRRRPPPGPHDRQWAEDLVRRLDRFGRAHGRPRSPSDTVVRHVDDLAEHVTPDPRLAPVARVISDALFGHDQPTVEQRLWAEQVVDEVIEAHPAPSRLSRRRRPGSAGSA